MPKPVHPVKELQITAHKTTKKNTVVDVVQDFVSVNFS